MAGLTTHVLDVASGRPATGMRLWLYGLADENDARLLVSAVTNADGRTDAALLAPGEAAAGIYELRFDVGSYFAAQGAVGEAPFLGLVPVRFAIADPQRHYHVPLLVAPWSYTTYRGS